MPYCCFRRKNYDRLPLPLALMFNSLLRNTLTPLTASAYRVATYRGCTAGWIPQGGARDRVDAERLAAIIRRIRPEFITRPIAV